LHDAVLRKSAARLFVFRCRNAEEKDGLKSKLEGALRFLDRFGHRKLKDARHARDWATRPDFLADEEREDEIVRGQFGLAHEIAQRRRTPETPRPMNKLPHRREATCAPSRSQPLDVALAGM
jgi:hypothetical protein